MTDIKENYDIPTDLKFVARPWYGLSWKEAGILLCSVVAAVLWLNVSKMLYIPEIMMKTGLVVIGLFALALIVLHLDVWMYHAIKWLLGPYYIHRFDTAAKQVSGIAGVDGDYYWNVDGDLCAILHLTAINSDRSDGLKAEDVEKADKNFLNSLPCPIQIVGYTYNYNIRKYISSMIDCAKGLPKTVMKYRVAHLNFYRKYVEDKNIRERVLYLIIKVDAQASDPKNTLDIYSSIISKNLVSSGVRGKRLSGAEIEAVPLMIATGIGEEGLEYLTPSTEVEA